MAKDEARQYVPIFVGSTFTDLRSYREAVSSALHRLETIVRGMEYFGSKPGGPVEECLAVVRSCNIYIGVFGMRYGSIPDDYDRSMTHLEYDEAQRHQLPSLIYIIDEQRQPVLPIHVETGDGAAKLKLFKEQLCKSHVVSFFTSAEDLAVKVLADLPPVLQKIGTRIDGELHPLQSDDPKHTPTPSTALEIKKGNLLVLKGSRGIAVVELTYLSGCKATYRWRYAEKPRGQETTGTGELFEQYGKSAQGSKTVTHVVDVRGELIIKAGPYKIEWSCGGTTSGYVYPRADEVEAFLVSNIPFSEFRL